MIYLRHPISMRTILLPHIPNLPMWRYLEDVIAPAAGLKVKDGTVYEWILFECDRDKRFPIPLFTRKNKHMRMGDVIPDGSRLCVTTGRPDHMYGNACFEDLIYVPMESNTQDGYDLFSKMMGMVAIGLTVLLLAMVLLHKFAEYVTLPPYDDTVLPHYDPFKTNTTNHSLATDLSNWFTEISNWFTVISNWFNVVFVYINWFMVISLYFIIRWMVSAWF